MAGGILIGGIILFILVGLAFAYSNREPEGSAGPVDAGPADAGQELVSALEMEVTCINKVPRADRYNHIKNVGGMDRTRGTRFIMSQPAAINYIQRGASFFVKGPHGRVPLAVITKEQSAVGRTTYIATVADETQADNLLSLPECI